MSAHLSKRIIFQDYQHFYNEFMSFISRDEGRDEKGALYIV